jgi:hypothetical protein
MTDLKTTAAEIARAREARARTEETRHREDGVHQAGDCQAAARREAEAGGVAVTSSDLYLALALQDERNKPSPYFHAIVLEQPEGPPRPPSEEAMQVLENARKRRMRA